ncbi:MAG: hypothetical protein LBF88_13995, partial [Planctomycetaceae bacterium]|nr:hypothetical protein [Planctomycetaceae bacterium]
VLIYTALCLFYLLANQFFTAFLRSNSLFYFLFLRPAFSWKKYSSHRDIFGFFVFNLTNFT